MAHFYGGVTGKSRTEATRLGTKNSGLKVFANGWHIGLTAHITHNGVTGKDEITVYITDGSGGGGEHKCLGTFVEGEEK